MRKSACEQEPNLPLEAQRDDVNDIHIKRNEQPGGAFIPKGCGSKAHCAPDIHRISQDIEGETLDSVVHEDAKVISEEGASNT